MQEFPKQVNELEINKVADGYVVYQPGRERVHYLNNTAAFVLELCDGQLAPDTIVQLLQEAFNLPKPPEAEVAECLKTLFQEGLVQ
jgi:hypothetical protein